MFPTPPSRRRACPPLRASIPRPCILQDTGGQCFKPRPCQIKHHHCILQQLSTAQLPLYTQYTRQGLARTWSNVYPPNSSTATVYRCKEALVKSPNSCRVGFEIQILEPGKVLKVVMAMQLPKLGGQITPSEAYPNKCSSCGVSHLSLKW